MSSWGSSSWVNLNTTDRLSSSSTNKLCKVKITGYWNRNFTKWETPLKYRNRFSSIFEVQLRHKTWIDQFCTKNNRSALEIELIILIVYVIYLQRRCCFFRPPIFLKNSDHNKYTQFDPMWEGSVSQYLNFISADSSDKNTKNFGCIMK